MLYLQAPGVRLAPVGEGWAAYSGLSGESHLLNGECVAVFQALDVLEPRSADAVAQVLSAEYGMTPGQMHEVLANVWTLLGDAGLIREAAAPAATLAG